MRENDGTIEVIEVPQSLGTVATGMNNDGQIVGHYWSADGEHHGFIRDTNGQFSTIDVPGAIETQAHSINKKGQIVGVYRRQDNALYGFLLDKGKFETVFRAAPDMLLPYAWGINDKSEIVGFHLYDPPNSLTEGFLLSHNNFYPFILPPSGRSGTVALGINRFGRIVGSYTAPGGCACGFEIVPKGV